MKTKILLSILTIGFILNTFCQKPTMELTFNAKNSGQYVPLDSILIENLTQGGDTTLYAPDTVLVLDYISSIRYNNTVKENTFSISQNYPNPFQGKTEIILYLPEKEYIQIKVQNILGQEFAQYENTLDKGNHLFSFYSNSEKYYLLTVIGKKTSETIKMVNTNNSIVNRGKCKIIYIGYEANDNGFKSQNTLTYFEYDLGDKLRYIGYARNVNEVNGSDIIESTPQTNEQYLFDIIEGIPCSGIPTITYGEQVYITVLIGSQCWLKENLNYETPNSWWYENNADTGFIYGRLYNWDDALLVCPEGWHLPSDPEWNTLEIELGLSESDAEIVGWRGDHATIMKSTNRWIYDPYHGNGTNSSGINIIPAGYRYPDGLFTVLHSGSGFWTDSEFSDSTAWSRGFSYGTDNVFRDVNSKAGGMSIRCLKDEGN